jgi:hypothetical protein
MKFRFFLWISFNYNFLNRFDSRMKNPFPNLKNELLYEANKFKIKKLTFYMSLSLKNCNQISFLVRSIKCNEISLLFIGLTKNDIWFQLYEYFWKLKKVSFLTLILLYKWSKFKSKVNFHDNYCLFSWPKIHIFI